MMNNAQKCKNILKEEGIDINSNIDFDVNGKVYSLTFGYIIDTFMLSNPKNQEVFLEALKKSLDTKEMKVEAFFEKMGQLLLLTHLSNKIEV